MDVALGRESGALPSRERAFVHELTYGVARLRGRLDHLLGAKVHRGLDSLRPRVVEILRLGAYQLLYMDGVPDYAAISQSVDSAKAAGGKGAGGLVNAVLRGVARDGDRPERFPDPSADPAGYLTTWGSHPGWLVDRWLARWPAERVEALVRSDNERPPLCLVPLDADVETAVAELAAVGIEAEVVGQGTECVRLAPGSAPREALAALPSIVQDPAANLVVRYADVPPGTKVADLCAAPGGKALALSRGAVYTVAADRSERRMQLVQENLARVGGAVGLVVADVLKPPISSADVVLLDVPCTGTGTLRRHPDGRWRLSQDQIGGLAAIQRDILDAAAVLVPPGGLLIYSTCTLEPEENEIQVKAFLDRHADFEVAPTDAVPARFVTDEGFLVVLPQDSGFDGSFAARLRRRSARSTPTDGPTA